jgi:hypothetical protein
MVLILVLGVGLVVPVRGQPYPSFEDVDFTVSCETPWRARLSIVHDFYGSDHYVLQNFWIVKNETGFWRYGWPAFGAYLNFTLFAEKLTNSSDQLFITCTYGYDLETARTSAPYGNATVSIMTEFVDNIAYTGDGMWMDPLFGAVVLVALGGIIYAFRPRKGKKHLTSIPGASSS